MADTFEPAQFARDFTQFLAGMNRLVPPQRSPMRDMLRNHLGEDPGVFPAVAEDLALPEHPNLQLALDELTAAGDWSVVGLPLGLRQFQGFSLASLATDRLSDYGLQSPRPGPVEYTNVPIGADSSLACVQLALYLGRWEDAPLVALVFLGDRRMGDPALTVEVLTSSRESAQSFLAHLAARRRALNVYRGQTLSFTFTPHGRFKLDFLTLPTVGRSELILPEADLDAIEQHTLGISAHAAALRAAGRHLRRGLLLHGPPGTGKTLSVMYLRAQMPDRTTVVINGGPGINLLGQAVALARAVQPSMVVLEDVDLVAHERTMPGQSTNPLLFQLLNEMDGLAEDADVIFVLTTNRLDLLEPALAMRPGRIDQAVEIKLPDAACRSRLLSLYLQGVPGGSSVDLAPLVAATAGVSAAFVKELVRRAVVLAAIELGDGGSALTISTRHMTDALAALDLAQTPLLASLLGAVPPTASPD